MENKLPRVGLVMKSLNADFFKDMQKGAEDFVKASCCCDLVAVGTDTQTEIDRQISLVDKLADEGVDAIVLVPIDSRALVAPAARAVAKGIIVVNIDIRLDEILLAQAGVSIDFVGPDNYAAAHAAGERLAASLTPGDKVAMIEGLRVADNARQRKAGFDAAIRSRGLRCVASEAANWETSVARDIFADIYTRHPDLKGVFCCNDAMALGVIDILKEAGRKPGEIKIAGFDNDAVMAPLLTEGWLYTTVDAYGSQMAVEGIRHALTLLDSGCSHTGDHPTPFTVIPV